MDDYGQELHIHGANEVFTGWVISPHNVATEEPKKESAKNPRQYVMPIKYVFGIKAHSTRETRQKQSKTNTNKPDKKQQQEGSQQVK